MLKRKAAVVMSVIAVLLFVVPTPPSPAAAVFPGGPAENPCAARAAVLVRTLSSPVRSGRYRTGDFVITWENCLLRGAELSVAHASDPGRCLWRNNRGRSFVNTAVAEATVKESRGSFDIKDRVTEYRHRQSVDSIRKKKGAVVIEGRFPGPDGRLRYEMALTAGGANRLDFEVRLKDNCTPGGTYNRVYLSYASSPDEHFFGFGEQFTYFDMKGRRVPILCQEQGIGRGSQPLTFLMNLFAGSGGSWHSTYTAVPHYISSRCRSLFLKDYEHSVFDMRCPDRVRIKQFSPSMSGCMLNGRTPLDLIEEYTEFSGRMEPLPDWINSGAVVGMQGGTARVLEELERLRAHDVPVAAFWLQDWVGKRVSVFASQLWWNWEVDYDHYPGWEALVDGLYEQGIRVMTYISPFMTDASGKPNHRRNLFEEARRHGYLVLDRNGEPYRIQSTNFDAGMLDLTNPDAREWYKGIIRGELMGAGVHGVRGWMADYAEALPFDCVLHSGEDPASYHNRYPEEWARLNREAVAEAGMQDEVVFFSRSGSARSPGETRLFWLGDQLVSWDEYDGIKSAVTGMLSGGISGYSLNHSDIGGYTTVALGIIPGIPIGIYRTRELLLRWMELSAFTAVFRTHEGSMPGINAQFYTDEETYGHFARFAKVYGALGFYRDELMEEAAAKGYPMVRHPFLHYPDDPEVYGLRHQFMLGSEFMIAPVLDPGAARVDVYLPAGEWVHLWTGDVYGSVAAGGRVNVDAPTGQPAVFYRRGSPRGQRLVEILGGMGVL